MALLHFMHGCDDSVLAEISDSLASASVFISPIPALISDSTTSESSEMCADLWAMSAMLIGCSEDSRVAFTNG